VSENYTRKKIQHILRPYWIDKKLITIFAGDLPLTFLHRQHFKTNTDMTKADIVNDIAKRTGVDKAAVQLVVESFMESVKDALIKHQHVYLRGFGSFIIKKRAEKVARNISKNTTITIPAHHIPAFKPAKGLHTKVKK
jgi:DNA-binding protein HU-beta